MNAASIVLAAGRGTRMIGFNGNKTVLPLIPFSRENPYEGDRPLIVEILSQLPSGPKSIVVHHDAETVKTATRNFDVEYVFQPELNGTGGAILSARTFIKSVKVPIILITMGDVALVRKATYEKLVESVSSRGRSGALVVFKPRQKAKYGCVITEHNCVKNIIEWQYWSKLPVDEQNRLELCNAGIYAFDKLHLLSYLKKLSNNPHVVEKTINGKIVKLKEFFLTDLIKMMAEDNLCIGYVEASEDEVMGIDTPESLRKAQNIYSKLKSVKSH